jgi:hypothetical protein
MGAIPPQPPGNVTLPPPMSRWQQCLMCAGVLCVIGSVIVIVIFGLWADAQIEMVDATIVTTYTTTGGLLSGGRSFTVYDTDRGRVIREGIWGNPGDELRITVKRY